MTSCYPALLPNFLTYPGGGRFAPTGWPISSVTVACFAPLSRPICSEKRSKTGGVVDGDLSATAGMSVVMTGHQSGSGIIHAEIPGLLSIDCGTISVITGGNGGGGGGSPEPAQVFPSGFAVNPALTLNSNGVISAAAKLQTADGKLTLEISNGTKLLTASNSVLTSLTVTPLASPPPASDGNTVVLAYTFVPDDAKFDPALTLTIAYDPSNLPSGVVENDLYITYFDGTQWQKLVTTIDPLTKTVSAKVSHFSAYALLGKVSEPVAPTPTPTPTPTIIPTPTQTLTQTPTPTPTTTPSLPQTVTPTAPSPSVTVQPTATPTATVSPITSAPAVVPSSTTTQPGTPAPDKSSDIPWGMIIGIIAGLIIVVLIIAFIMNKRKK
jgi:hypothetical protein